MAGLRKVNLEWEEKVENLIILSTELQDKNIQLT
jgi:hypothetical protein